MMDISAVARVLHPFALFGHPTKVTTQEFERERANPAFQDDLGKTPVAARSTVHPEIRRFTTDGCKLLITAFRLRDSRRDAGATSTCSAKQTAMRPFGQCHQNYHPKFELEYYLGLPLNLE
jgi:hypothetical protein